MIKDSVSIMTLKTIYFNKISLSRDIEIDEDSIGFGFDVNYKLVGDEITVLFSCAITDNADLKILIEMTGVFHIDTDDLDFDIDEKHPLVQENTLAIMFPYLRSEISLITTQPGMRPITLPVLNIVKLLENMRRLNEEKG